MEVYADDQESQATMHQVRPTNRLPSLESQVQAVQQVEAEVMPVGGQQQLAPSALYIPPRKLARLNRNNFESAMTKHGGARRYAPRWIPLAVPGPNCARLRLAGRPYVQGAGARALAPIAPESASPASFLRRHLSIS